jgi:nuclear pore complex protein Nup62
MEDLSETLTTMIETVNGLSNASNDSKDGQTGQNDDPMAQIVQILSSHLESLQWIDGAVKDMEGKVGDVEKRLKDAGGATTGSGIRRGYGLNR